MTHARRLLVLSSLAGLDALAAGLLVRGSAGEVALASGMHGGLCLLSTWVLFAGESPWSKSGFLFRLLAYALALATPVIGTIGMLVTLRSAFRVRVPTEPEWDKIPIDDPRLQTTGRRAPHLSSSRIAGVLQARTDRTAADRFRAVLQVARFPLRAGVALLYSCLKDPFDEVRLYAFARLERMRDDLDATTRRLTQSLNRAESDAEKAALNLSLAEIQHESCYLGLADGAIRDDVLEGARRHAIETLRLSPGNAPASFLLGRLNIMTRRYPEAIASLWAAIEAGFPRPRVLPYLAEAYFVQRHFGAVRALMQEIAESPTALTFPPRVVEFWR